MAETKRRTVVCDIHGLRYDPSLSSGCIRCRREGLVPRAQSRFLPLLLAVLAFTLIAARLVTAILDNRGGPDVEESAPAAGNTDPRLDTERFRQAITRVDDILYPQRIVDFGILGSQAARSIETLAADIAARGRDDVATEMRRFSADLGAAELDAFGLDGARGRWYELQQRFFLPADWMRSPSDSTGPDAARVSAYVDFASDLERLIDEAASQGIDDDWVERLDALETRRPPTPAFDADQALVLGNRALSDGLAAVRRAVAQPDAADGPLEDAKRALEDMSQHLGNLRL